MIDCAEGLDYFATEAADLPKVPDFEKEWEAVSCAAEIALDKMKKLQPIELEIKFGIELGGQFKIPFLTKHEGKANFKVTLKWVKDSKGDAI